MKYLSLKPTCSLWVLAVSVLACSIWPVAAFPEGPPPAHTGANGQPDCSVCHFAGPEPTANSGLTITSFPQEVSPGAVYELKLQLLDPEQRAGGFQVAIVNTETARVSVGEWIVDENQRIDSENDIVYLGHSEPKSAVHDDGSGEMLTEWILRWRAPSENPGPLRIIAAAVASDHDESPLGDAVYVFKTSLNDE